MPSFWSKIRSRNRRSGPSGRVRRNPPTIEEPKMPSNPGLAVIKFLVPGEFRGEDNKLIRKQCPAYQLRVFKMTTLTDYRSGYPYLRLELEFTNREHIDRHLYLELRHYKPGRDCEVEYHTERALLPPGWITDRILLSDLFFGKMITDALTRFRILATPPHMVPCVLGQVKFMLEPARPAYMQRLEEKQRRFEQGDAESSDIEGDPKGETEDFVLREP